MHPRIGITCNQKGLEMALSVAYVRAVYRAGAIPLLLPVCGGKPLWRRMLKNVDGLILSGGGDPDASLFGSEAGPLQGAVSPDRDQMELYLAKAVLKLKMPVLGICRGAQMLAIAAGGTLHQDLREIAAIQHEQKAPRTYPIHRVKIKKPSLLYSVVGAAEIRVNSMHHQAVSQTGSMKVSAVSGDGIIESLEHPGHPFALGVQWHPEWLAGRYPHAGALFTALRDQCVRFMTSAKERKH